MNTNTNTATTAKELSFRVYNGLHGWNAESNTTESGSGWQITTSKGANGTINSTARHGEFFNSCFSFMMFGGKSLSLINEKGRATEKSITEQHERALILFAEQTADEPEAYEIKVGQKLCFIGYESNERPEIVIYNIKKGGFGLSYETINTRTKKLSSCDNLRDLADKFGTGTYYIKDSYFEDLEALNLMVSEAKQTELMQEAKEQEEADKAKAERQLKIEAGKKIVSIPSGTSHIIVAQFMKDESDSQSDYFASSVQRTVYLAFSNHKRDLFAEMRKACLNSDDEEIQRFALAPEVNNNGVTQSEYIESMKEYYTEAEAVKNWFPEDEHRNKYSMGDGYFLGTSSRSGWKIRKIALSERNEDVYISTQEGRFFCNVATVEETKTAPNFEEVEVTAGEIQIVDYSEKAIAVIGDTKPIKDKLKELGGRFNFRLSCGAGWIFPKTKLEEVEAFLSA